MMGTKIQTTKSKDISTRIEESRQGTRILDCADRDIKETLAFIYVLLGINPDKYPKGVSNTVLIGYMKTILGRYTLEEVRLAFEQAIAGKFEVELDLYDRTFNSLFLQRVMNAWSAYRGGIICEVAMIEEITDLSQEEKMQKMAEYTISLFERMRDDGVYSDNEFTEQKHDFLYNIGLMPVANDEYRAKLLEEATAIWKNRLMTDLEFARAQNRRAAVEYFRDLLKCIETDSLKADHGKALARFAKQLKVRDFLFDCIKTERDLKTEIQKAL